MKIKSSPVTLFLMIALTRAFGLVRSLYLARLWGSTGEAASFELATSVSAVLYDTVAATVISAMFLPAYVSRDTESDREKDRFVSSLIVPVLLMGVFLYLPLIVFPKGILSLCVRGKGITLISQTAPALRLQAFGRATLPLSCLFVGVLQSEGAAVEASFLYCLSSFLSLVAALLFSDLLTALSLSATLAVLDILLLTLLSRFVAKRRHLTISTPPRFRFSKHTLVRAVWVILSGTFLPLLTLFTTLSSANLAGSEGISLNGYAGRLILLTAALLISVTHATYYATMARNKSHKTALKPIFIRLFLLSAAVAFAIIAFAPLIVRLLYQGSALTDVEIRSLSRLLSVYAPSVISLTLSSFLSDLAYLRGKTAHIAIGNFLAIGVVGILYSLFGSTRLTDVPFYFTLAAYLRLGFALGTLASKKARDIPRILLVLSDRNVGGAGRWLITYLKYADKTHFEIHVALPEHAELKKTVEALGYPVYTMGSERSFSLKNTLSACRLILKLHPDLINTSASLSARIAAFLLRVPVRLYTRHCVYPPSALYRIRLVRLLNRTVSRLLSHVAVAVAHEAKDNLVTMGIAQKRVMVIENGVSPMPRGASRGQDIRRRYGIENAHTVTICARLEKDKSIHTLIEAIAILKKRNIPFHAFIVGTGREETTLRSLTQILGVSEFVHFCGFVADVSPYLNAADVYANCSVGSEATSLAIAEAMSVSLPIVASDYGGNPHMVIDGYNGIIVKQSSSSELADALMILTDRALCRAFGNASLERYAAHYRADRMARRYEALYQTLLQRKGYPT